jgi:hypothetical protein
MRAVQASAVRLSVPRRFIATTEFAEIPRSLAQAAPERPRPAAFIAASHASNAVGVNGVIQLILTIVRAGIDGACI